ncbi:MAG: hypothetical protein IGS48_03525 [Oscillatoriales cyanobacterium C42_A2020_001]|nr:hypothetical protein [Leptolyngbyaceae cyanobacterium C42_A2020_001]
MKNSVFPVAISLLATVVAPLQANANESFENESFEAESNPVLGETSADVAQTDMPVEAGKAGNPWADASGAISFEPPSKRSEKDMPTTQNSAAIAAAAPAQSEPPQTPTIDSTKTSSAQGDMFAGGSESLVARTVGAAEGTRTADGGKTQNYHGHVDPGNGVWNRGTFSYQFGNEENLSPDESDRRQLAKIKRIYESVMLPKAEKHGVAPLTVAEEINGIDLINQAPLAVTEEGGYIERLAQAKKEKGLAGDEAILEARVWAFWDGDKGGWDAPGLRAYDDISKEESIRRDQDRRMAMISKALESYEQQNGGIAKTQPPQKADQRVADARSLEDKSTQSSAIADAIIRGSHN